MCDLLRFLFCIHRGNQIVKSAFDHGKPGDIIIDAKDIVQTSVIVTDIGCAAFGLPHRRKSSYKISGMILQILL